jgi:hypothetical protein
MDHRTGTGIFGLADLCSRNQLFPPKYISSSLSNMNVYTRHHRQDIIDQRHVRMWTATLLINLALMVGGIILGIRSLSNLSGEDENIKTDKGGPIMLLVNYTGLISLISFIMIVSLTMNNSILLLKYLTVLSVIVFLPYSVLMMLSTYVVIRVIGIFVWVPCIWHIKFTNKVLSRYTDDNLGNTAITFCFVITSLIWTIVLFLGVFVIGLTSGLTSWFRIYINTISDISGFISLELSMFLFALYMSMNMLTMQVIHKNHVGGMIINHGSLHVEYASGE